MFADGPSPLNSFTRPFPTDLQQPLRHSDTGCRKREPARIQRRKRDLKPCTFLGDHVLARHAHVGEFHDPVIKGAKSHEPATISNFHAGPVHIDDKRSDLLAFPSADDFGRRAAITTSTPAFTPFKKRQLSRRPPMPPREFSSRTCISTRSDSRTRRNGTRPR